MSDDRGQPPRLDARRFELFARLLAERGVASAPIIPLVRGSRIPASFAQEQVWFLGQLEGELPVRNVTKAFWLRGKLDPDALERAVASVVARHEALRTVLIEEDGALSQVVLPAGTYDFDRSVLPHGVTDRVQAVVELAAAQARWRFDLTRGPLLRANLVAVDTELHVFILSVHHVVADGWSAGLLIGELCRAYRSHVEGCEPELAPLVAQYADVAVWQRIHEADARARGLAHFRTRLEDAPPPPELPISHPPALPRSGAAGEVPVVLSDELDRRIQAVGLAFGCTPFEVLLAAFATLLNRLCGASDIVIGTPFANRQRKETENLIGLFANTVALRIDLSGRPTFSTVLERVRAEARTAARYQGVPFHHVIDEVRRARRRSADVPLFSVWFALQNWPVPRLELPGLSVDPVPVEAQAIEFELSLDLWRSHERLGGRLEFARDSFTHTAATRIAAQYRRLLADVLAAPHDEIARFALHDADEQHRLIELGRGASVTTVSFLEHLARQVARAGDEPAVVSPAGTLTFAELDRQSDAMASRLRRSGLAPDRLAALLIAPGLDLAVAMIAVLKAGGAFIPIDPDTPSERIAQVLEDARPLLVISGIDEDDEPAAAPPELADAAPLSEALAYVIYTSGSSGRPKGVAVSHRSLATYIAAAIETFGLSSADRMLQFAPISFDVLIEETFPAWAAGAAVVFRGEAVPLEPRDLVALVRQYGITVVEISNLYWQLLLEEVEADRLELPSSLRLLLVGCGAMSTERVRRWSRTGIELIHVYGVSEVTVTSTVCAPSRWSIEHHPWPRLPIGRAVPGSLVYVLDRDLVPTPPGVKGEIYLGGDLVARGYVGAPAATADRFVPDPFDGRPGARMFRTGDMARLLEDGNIDFLGRADDQIKVRGFRVELAELDAALMSLPNVVEAASIAIRDEDGDHRLIAFVAPRRGARLENADLARRLRARLPAYMCPAELTVVPGLPQTAHGKVDRVALAKLRCALPEKAVRVPLTTTTEHTIAGVWQDLLGVDVISGDDDFFALGGHSLLAARVAARLRERLAIDVPLRMVIEAPELRMLARAIDVLERAPTASIPVRKGGDTAPASFMQEHLWFLHRMEPASPAYNVPAAVRLRGPLDADALDGAFDYVCRRHEVLRTVFVERNGTVWQQILPVPGVKLERISASETELSACVRDVARRPFALTAAPGIRAVIVAVAPGDHVLVVSLHHIIADAWSVGVLVDELTRAYEDIAAGRSPRLPPLPVQFADVATWQREQNAGERAAIQRAYWQQRLADVDHGTMLPTDLPRPAISSGRGATLGFRLSSATARALRAFVRASGISTASAFLAGFGAVLRRRVAEPYVTVGFPAANRDHPDTHHLIGCLLTTLVARFPVGDDATFESLARTCHRTLAEALGHGDLPFEEIVDAVRPARDLSHHPLFEIMFSYERAAAREQHDSAVTIEPFGVHTSAAQFDLTLDIVEHGDDITGVFCYATDLYHEATIAALRDDYLGLLDAAAQEPSRRMPTLWRGLATTVQPTERAKPLPARRDLGSAILDVARRQPHELAVITPTGTLSYSELLAAAFVVARDLVDRGIGIDDKVAVVAQSGATLAVGALACWLAGAAFLPLDPTHPEARRSEMLRDAGVKATIAASRTAPAGDFTWVPIDVPASATAYTTFTSGSTGRPKAVAVSHEALLNFAIEMATRMSLRRGDRVLQFAPIPFDVLLEELLPAWISGAAVVLGAVTGIPEPRELLSVMQQTGVTHVELPSRYWEQVVDEVEAHPERLPATLRAVLLGCDPPNRGAIARWRRTGVSLLHVFGLTETAVTSTVWPIVDRDDDPAPVPIGHPIANTSVHVLDDRLEPVGLGTPGQLYVGGVGVARGYVGDPALTAERFVPDPFGRPGERLYRTGDRVRIRADGALEFIGRLDHQVKVRGFRIELAELEAALRNHDRVREACAWTEQGPTGSLRLVAAVVPRGAEPLDGRLVRAHLATLVPAYMVPSRLAVVRAFPRTPSGKIDRERVPQLQELLAQPSSGRPLDGPTTVLGQLWCEVLGVSEVRADDNFFEIGGDSLLSLALVARLRARGFELSPRDVFQTQNLGDMAAAMRAAPPQEREPASTPAPFSAARLSPSDLAQLLDHVERLRR